MDGEKAALRRLVRAQAAAMAPEARRESDAALFARLEALPEWRAARALLLFAGMGAEPDTCSLLPALFAAGKAVALPRCLPNRGLEARWVGPDTALVRHRYGMLEPGEDCPRAELEALDFLLVPGLAFDSACRRLGQGGGYYDRLLCARRPFAAALCRDRFLVERVPCAPHDRAVDAVVTETRLLSRSCP